MAEPGFFHSQLLNKERRRSVGERDFAPVFLGHGDEATESFLPV
jgi:hypothetical protein